MQRALDLAQNGQGLVSPNPMVGCVVVYDNKIIGEGWHQKFGQAHAEVNAINCSLSNLKLVNKDKLQLKKSIVYITLEPCSYHGKTPSCVNLLIRLGVKKVIIATLDPNPKVFGRGVRALKSAGIDVELGLLEKEAIALNRRFFINQKIARPYVVLKWAQTKNGFIAHSDYSSKWISNPLSRQIAHKWRAEEDAILIGKNTAYYDNPSLTVRDWQGLNPTRVVLDRNLSLRANLKVFNGEAQTLIYNYIKNEKNEKNEKIKLSSSDFILSVLTNLYSRELSSLIVEGGGKLLNSFIQLGLWDEARVFIADQKFEKGIDAPKIKEAIAHSQPIGSDELNHYLNPKTTPLWSPL